MKTKAWLHSIEAADWGVNTIWLTGKKVIKAFYPLSVDFYLIETTPHIKQQVLSHPQVSSVDECYRRISIHDVNKKVVFRLAINPKAIRSTYKDLRDYWDPFLFNVDLSVWQYFCFQTDLFPYAYTEITVENSKLRSFKIIEPITEKDYRPIPMKTIWFEPVFEDNFLQRGRVKSVKISNPSDSREWIIFDGSERELIEDAIKFINSVDPDVILTKGGDKWWPAFAKRVVQNSLGDYHIGRSSINFTFLAKRKSESNVFMSYGRFYTSMRGVYFNNGLHHFDIRNSFMYSDGKLEGIIEISRLGSIDPQRVARATIGTALTSIQLRVAYNQGLLIPKRKADAENFKKAWTISSDVGGLVFSPKVGFHQNVVELDFQSMYPTIMVKKNISPETINCHCCAASPIRRDVPFTNYYICSKRRGLIPQSLIHILERRKFYKEHQNENRSFKLRQKVLKWLLVTSFGYQGYRNARFGRIEAHEAINAFGRVALVQLHSNANKIGLETCAGIVDSIWLKKKNERPITAETIDQLINKTERDTDLLIEHVADYKWIVFLPRKNEPTIGALNRYYGLKNDGTFKVRGIQLRQTSSPGIIKSFQREILKTLARANNRQEFFQLAQQAKSIITKYSFRLFNNEIPFEQLLIDIRLGKKATDYKNNIFQAIAAKQLANLSNSSVRGGRKVSFLIIDSLAKKPEDRVKIAPLLSGNEKIDIKKYRSLLLRAFDELLPPVMLHHSYTLDCFL